MPSIPFTRRTRSLLAQLASLVAQRTQDQADAQRVLDAELDAARRAYKDAATATQTQARTDLAATRAEHQARLDELKSSHQRQLDSARSSFDREVKEFRSKTSALETAAARKLEDGQWLIDTMIESGETKLKKEFESVRRSLMSLNERVDQLGAQGQAALEKFSHRPLPAPPEDATHWAVPEDIAGMREKCEQLVAAAGGALAEMQRRIKPRFLGPATFVFIPMLLIIAGAVAGVLAIGEPLRRSALMGAASGAVLAVLIFVPLRFVLRGRVPPAAEKLSRQMAEARRTIEHSIRLADVQVEERKQQLRKQAENEAAKVKLEVNQLRYEAYRRKTEEEPVFVLDHENTIVELRARLESELKRAEGEFQSAIEVIEDRERDELARAQAVLDQATSVASAHFESQMTRIESAWRAGVGEVYAGLEEVRRAAEASSAPWASPAWSAFTPPTAIPDLVSIGAFRVDVAALPGGLSEDPRFALPGPSSFDVPAPLDLRERGSVLLQAGGDSRAAALGVLQNIMLRMLTALPPAKIRFTIIDPVGLGESFAGFMHLADYDQQLVGDKIWTEPRHIEQKLTDLTEHMETVIQKYLRNEFATIQDYNEKAGEIAEPYRFLVIADFPAGFSEAAAKRLASIVASGPRCGVFTLILMDTRQRPPAWVPLADLERGSATISFRGGKPGWQEDSFGRWPLVLDTPPDDELFNRLIHETGRNAKDSGRVQVPFETVAPTPPDVWSRSAADEIRVPIGRAGATKIQNLALGRGTAQHALIAGRTGSGKSTLLHAIITSAALWYSPDDVELYLVDFKKGVEFKTYATHRLPHARVIAVESEREFGLSVLRRLDAELARRGELYRSLGVQDLAGYRKATREHGGAPAVMPRVLLIVDEFQEFFVADDKIAQEAALLLDRLVRQGRAFGVHVVLGSQTIGGVYSLARSTIGQMAVRIALQCSEADSYLIMSEDNAAARLLSRPGEAIYNDASGMVEGNSPFQVVWLPDEKREGFLATVRGRADHRRVPPIVFEGNVPSDIATNNLLSDLLEGRTPPQGLSRAWLGEAISIKDPTFVAFKRQSSANLIIVGQQDLPSLAVTTAAVVSLVASTPADRPGPPESGALLPLVTVLDGTVMEEGGASPFEKLAAGLPGVVRRAGVREADAAVAELHAELLRRQQPGAPEGPPRFLVVYGLQRFRSLRRAEEDFGFGGTADGEASTPDQKFMNIVREGPALGIHVVMWVNTAATLERALDRRALREFDGRVLFQMSQADSSTLIDGPQAAQLGQHRALYFSEETGVMEKFRPYAMPTDQWIESVVGRLRGLTGGAIHPRPLPEA
ncbi:MAG: AAA family ATPase [Phycisphaerales bacterium]|nr:AAA family ATPase [Phycisphaerales bacterium]